MEPSKDFERYRATPPVRITLPRLALGTILIIICWVVTTLVMILPAMSWAGAELDKVMESNVGMFATLLSFGGIWIGTWLAVRFIHRDRLGNVLGADGRICWSDFGKGFAAVTLTSILSEIMIYAIRPELARSELPLSSWLAALVPMMLLCLLQTSSEELLFRGYLLRGLANRFRSPWIWGVLPGFCFIMIHYTPGMTPKDMVLILLTIGSLTIVLVALVYVTGNLGASMGVHMGNNLLAFLFVGHQDGLTYYTLFKGAPVGDGTMTAGQTTALVITGWICVALTWWLLASRRSPFNVRREGAAYT